MKRLVWLLLTASMWAQTQGNLPDFVQSITSRIDLNPVSDGVQFGHAVQSGDWIIGTYNYDANRCSSGNALTDTLGISWNYSSVVSVSFPGVNVGVQIFWGKATSSGTEQLHDTCSASLTVPDIAAVEFKNLGSSLTVDGSLVSDTNSSTSITSMSHNYTTSTNNALLVDVFYSPQSYLIGPQTQLQAGANTGHTALTWAMAGAAGSKTLTLPMQGNTGAHITLAFQTPAAIATTVLHDAIGGFYSCDQLMSVNWTGTQSWSASGIPAGLTLDSSTGKLCGVPSASGTYTLTSVSDGTSSTSLTLNVGHTGARCPNTLRSAVTNSIGETWDLASIVSGDELAVCMLGHASQAGGFLESDASFSTACTPGHSCTCSGTDTFSHIWGVPMAGKSGFIVCYKTKTSCSGDVRITDSRAESSGSPVSSVAMDFGFVQDVVSNTVFDADMIHATSGTLTSDNYALNDAKGMLGSFAGTTSPSPTAVTYNSPFSVIGTESSSFASAAEADYSPGATGSYSATAAFSSLLNPSSAGITVFDLRPSFDNSACNGLVRHRAQIINQF